MVTGVNHAKHVFTILHAILIVIFLVLIVDLVERLVEPAVGQVLLWPLAQLTLRRLGPAGRVVGVLRALLQDGLDRLGPPVGLAGQLD